MSRIDRRTFLTLSAAAACSRALKAAAATPALSPTPPSDWFSLVATVDKGRILRQADQWLHDAPKTITSYPSPMNPGSLHDYFSQADYFWPDPKNPGGPYKSIDGVSNPNNFQGHRHAMVQFSIVMPALAAAYLLTKNKEYGRAAAAHLLAWFVAAETRMNPNLEYAQGVHGGANGNSFGIIDTVHLVEPARAAGFLREFCSDAEWKGLQDWFTQYLAWIKTSKNGQIERAAPQNHSMSWALQAAEFARFIGDKTTQAEVQEHFIKVQLPDQMALNGSFPRELARTKPYSYSVLNFDLSSTLCWSLGGAKMERFALPDGRGLCRAAEFLSPYLADKSKWPYPHDVQHWDSWPARSVGLLFTGLACSRPEYIDIWRHLEPDPQDGEMLRIKQPLLWVA